MGFLYLPPTQCSEPPNNRICVPALLHTKPPIKAWGRKQTSTCARSNYKQAGGELPSHLEQIKGSQHRMERLEVGLEPEEHERFLTSGKGRVMAGKKLDILKWCEWSEGQWCG